MILVDRWYALCKVPNSTLSELVSICRPRPIGLLPIGAYITRPGQTMSLYISLIGISYVADTCGGLQMTHNASEKTCMDIEKTSMQVQYLYM